MGPFRGRAALLITAAAYAFFSLLVSSAAAAPEAAEAATTHGRLRGVLEDGIYSFKGAPYAAPPVGERRWAPPAPPAPWRDVRPAERYGAACMQRPGLSAANGGDPGQLDEDCLYLNVWTPSLDPLAKLPVVVWIHGGAYVFGAGGLDGYDGTPSARKGVVFVNLNYRLGPLGFFAHPALPKGAYNFGLLDQVAALEWVRDNIANFGGNPKNVTIMGQSAGAKSVLAHFASPRSRGLFHKGVAMSAYVLPDASLDVAREKAGKIANAVGLEGAVASLEALRSAPAESFFAIDDPTAALGPVPIVGGAMLPRAIRDSFADRKEAALPLVIGSTSDDGSVISAFGLDPKAIVDKLGAAKVGLNILYPKMPEDERARQALRDVVFTMNPRWVADRHSRRASTWRYYFDYVAEKDRGALPNGAPHGYEVAFMLDTLPLADGIKDRYTEADSRFAAQASAYLIAFAASASPSPKGAPDWTKSTRLRDRTLVLGPRDIKVERRFKRPRLNGLINVSRLAGLFE